MGTTASSYYLELEKLLERVESARNHYEVLGITRSTSKESINIAYRQAVSLLHPTRSGEKIGLPNILERRSAQALEKLAQAYAVLAHFGKRTAYDNSLSQRPSAPIHFQMPDSAPRTVTEQTGCKTSQVGINAEAVAQQRQILGNFGPVEQCVYVEVTSEDDRRRCPRFPLSIPVRVTGYDINNNRWQDMGQTINVSRQGLGLTMHKRVRRGMLLHLQVPLPTKLRKHGYSDPSYNVWAIVRRVEPPRDGVREVGVEFIGEHPPPGFLANPAALYRDKRSGEVERRREERKLCCEEVKVEFIDESLGFTGKERGTLENVSRSGARVRLKSIPAEFDLAQIAHKKSGFKSLASVRDWFTGKDGDERLCLQFLEAKWPV